MARPPYDVKITGKKRKSTASVPDSQADDEEEQEQFAARYPPNCATNFPGIQFLLMAKANREVSTQEGNLLSPLSCLAILLSYSARDTNIIGLEFIQSGILPFNEKAPPRRQPEDPECINLSVGYIASLLIDEEDSPRWDLPKVLEFLHAKEERLVAEKSRLCPDFNMNTIVLACIRASVMKSTKASRVHHQEYAPQPKNCPVSWYVVIVFISFPLDCLW